ncbi:MAG: D-alanyl-D-alanine carboxypeptidase/D-alanyl-D-alanine-endopeptidase [Gemmatimonadetes bacterium]|nr:D-alanyl-D-alanine carboxypeptidase/D-alanyl-D-alanine-endopeptidase [Gemmatimonadota bacterium]
MDLIRLAIFLVGSLGVPTADGALRTGPEPVSGVQADPPAIAALRDDLDRILRGANLRTRDAGLIVVSLDHGDTLYAHNADTPLIPASNLKLFTTAAALWYLGPTFQFNTYLLTTGPIRDGRLEGDLVFYGTGDPTLSQRFGTDLPADFADTLLGLGVLEVRGDIVGDASYFDGSGLGTGWQAAYSNALYAAPASALSIHESIAILEVSPGASAGDPATIRLTPGNQGIGIDNRVTTIATGRSSVRVNRAGYAGPLVVEGRVSVRSGPIRWSVPVADPARFAAGALRAALEVRGIAVTGEVRTNADAGTSPVPGRSLFTPAPGRGSPIRVLAIHTSPPLFDMLEVINKRSNNFLAEQVVRTVARVAQGSGSVRSADAAIGHFAARIAGLDSGSVRLFDGSGLSPLNRASARTIAELLAHVSASPLGNVFRLTLPETGAPDGLRRMVGTVADGRIRAKTGTIQSVSALSGYVATASGERLVFSILNNRATSSLRAKRVEDEIGIRLARFDRATVQGEPGSEPPR